MYSCLARSAPMAANQRVKKDMLTPAMKVGKDIYTEELLQIIDNCLKLDYLERPQSVFSLQKTLMKEVTYLETKKPSFVSKIRDALSKPL
jgi:hypothetical protein